LAIEILRVSQSKKTSEFTRGRRLFLTDRIEINAEELAAEIHQAHHQTSKLYVI